MLIKRIIVRIIISEMQGIRMAGGLCGAYLGNNFWDARARDLAGYYAPP